MIKDKYNKIFDKIIDIVADALALREMFLIFVIIAVVPLFFSLPSNIFAWQSFVSQTFVQLVALSVLAYQGKKGSNKQERLLKETHDAEMSELENNKQMHIESYRMHNEVISKLNVVLNKLDKLLENIE
jgi:hypothetical protein